MSSEGGGDVSLAAGDLVLEELQGSRFDQRVALQLSVLRMGADPQVPDETHMSGCHPRTVSETVA